MPLPRLHQLDEEPERLAAALGFGVTAHPPPAARGDRGEVVVDRVGAGLKQLHAVLAEVRGHHGGELLVGDVGGAQFVTASHDEKAT